LGIIQARQQLRTYFVLQVLRRYGIEPSDLQFIQSGGQVENLAALFSGHVDAATDDGPVGRRARCDARDFVTSCMALT
jgi:hypothetical protein